MLRFNPVVQNGLFQVTLGAVTKKYRAVDSAEAKWKLCRFVGVDLCSATSQIDVVVVEPTQREGGTQVKTTTKPATPRDRKALAMRLEALPRLEAENARLREALQAIADRQPSKLLKAWNITPVSHPRQCNLSDNTRELARAALKVSP